jgi:hypothetical protein
MVDKGGGVDGVGGELDHERYCKMQIAKIQIVDCWMLDLEFAICKLLMGLRELAAAYWWNECDF